MEKIDFKNKGETGATPVNADNLNLLQDNVEDSINDSKIQLKSTKTESNEAGYNCNYINSLTEEIRNGCYTCAFSSKTSVNIFSRSNYDNCLVISSACISILQMQGTNAPIIRDVYGTHYFSVTFDGTKIVISDLYDWDRYIILGSNGVTKIE